MKSLTPSTPLIVEEEAPRRRAYSYQRFSSPAQADGDSLRRQRSKVLAYAKANNLILDENSFQDLGVSAFRGKNVEIGALGMFRRAVEDGLIPQGSVLLVENLDRISRLNYRAAEPCWNGPTAPASTGITSRRASRSRTAS